MKLSTRSRYGTRMMLEIAKHYKQGPIQLGNIAKHQGISVKYLEQIIIPLKHAKYVKSVRGAKGGHLLAKAPENITIGEIVALLEGGSTVVACSDDPGSCHHADGCVVRTLWREAAVAMYKKLNSVTLSELVRRDRKVNSA